MAPKHGIKRKAADVVGKKEEGPTLHMSLQERLKLAGEVFVWGEGDCGQLGTGPNLMGRYRPTHLASLAGKALMQVECGGMHSCVLTNKGEVYTWGVNDENALGRETDDDGSTIPGKVEGLPVSKGETIVQVAAGDSHSCALSASGELWAWGTYRDENGPMGLTLQTKIAPTPIQLPYFMNERRVIKIASGADHTIALLQPSNLGSSTVLTWGSGTQGQLGRTAARMSLRHRTQTYLTPAPVHLPGGSGPVVTDVFAGYYGSFILTAKDKVYACGLNNFGQLGVPPCAPFFTFHLIKTLSNQKVVQLALGQHHGLALTAHSKSSPARLLSFGTTSYGRLGREVSVEWKEQPSALPEAIPHSSFQAPPVQISAGIGISGCVCSDGSVYTWGCNVSFQNGKGDDDEDELLPRKIPETKGYNKKDGLQLEFGGQHVLLLVKDHV